MNSLQKAEHLTVTPDGRDTVLAGVLPFLLQSNTQIGQLKLCGAATWQQCADAACEHKSYLEVLLVVALCTPEGLRRQYLHCDFLALCLQLGF